MPRPRAETVLAPALLALLALPSAASGQSAADVIRDVRQDYEARTRGIENYTVVQRVMGQEVTLHFVRSEIDGIVVFQPASEGAEGQGSPGGSVDPAFFFRPEVAERMTYEGRGSVEGQACHEVSLDDFEGLGLEEALPGGSGVDFESLGMCIDDDEHVVRRLVMKGAPRGGESGGYTLTAVLSDYREVGGMLHPWRVEMTTEGLGAMGQNPEMAEAMARMREQLEQLPEAQRKQMEAMMESRMEAVQGAMGMVAGEPIVVETVDVRVNEGRPSGG